jgi:hypothetical protein
MAAAKKANEAQFYFFCGTLDASTFEVVEFQGGDGESLNKKQLENY